jgi:hypothetical protein
MSSTLLMERTGMGMSGMGVSGLGSPTGAPTGVPMGTNFLMVPRCTLKLEKCTGGFKITCVCDDKVTASMVQNLCTMLQGGMCSCCVMFNGMPVNLCNLTMGMCRCEPTDSGCCITCTSGDKECCEMIQACCDCISCCLNAGCTCCVMMNNTPVCCGCSDACKSGSSKAQPKR